VTPDPRTTGTRFVFWQVRPTIERDHAGELCIYGTCKGNRFAFIEGDRCRRNGRLLARGSAAVSLSRWLTSWSASTDRSMGPSRDSLVCSSPMLVILMARPSVVASKQSRLGGTPDIPPDIDSRLTCTPDHFLGPTPSHDRLRSASSFRNRHAARAEVVEAHPARHDRMRAIWSYISRQFFSNLGCSVRKAASPRGGDAGFDEVDLLKSAPIERRQAPAARHWFSRSESLCSDGGVHGGLSVATGAPVDWRTSSLGSGLKPGPRSSRRWRLPC
jgi:hypothetical protein